MTPIFRRIFFYSLLAAAGMLCISDLSGQAWQTGPDFPGDPRTQSSAFSIGDKSYVVAGFSGGNERDFHRDLWSYAGETNTWERLAYLPGSTRDGGVGFSVGGKGYFGLGNYYGQFFKDLWRYDPVIRQWEELAEFPGESRSAAMAFTFNGKAYVGGGNKSGSILNDLWEYNAKNDHWKLKTKIPLGGRSAASVFIIDGKVYLVGGVTGLHRSLTRQVDVYDPVANKWAIAADFPGAPRRSAGSFTVNGKGVVAGGWDRKFFLKDSWRYSPDSAKWEKVGNLPVGIADPVVFSSPNYIMLGTGSIGPLQYEGAFYRYQPEELLVMHEQVKIEVREKVMEVADAVPKKVKPVKQKKEKAIKEIKRSPKNRRERKEREGVVLEDDQAIGLHGTNTSIYRVAASTSTLLASDLNRSNPGTLADAMNAVPGVSMHERGLAGSRRISIRGSLLRSPFGVRNVKAYWNEIPITSPDGSTPMELFDPHISKRIEIIKGPSGTAFGAGNGGVMRFFSAPTMEDQKGIEAQLTAGSYGQVLAFGRATLGNKKHRLVLTQINANNLGYRDQEANSKDHYIIESVSNFSERSKLALLASYYDGFWELPGSVDSATFHTAPITANPFSVAANAHVDRKRLRIGASHRFNIEDKFTHVIALYYNNTSKINPYGTSNFFQGYKDEKANGYGGRTDFTFLGRALGLDQKLVVGAEFQQEGNTLQEFDNNLGEPGKLRLDGRTNTTQAFAFGILETELGSRILLSGGASYNMLSYDHTDDFQWDSANFSNIHEFEPIISPRIGLILNPGKRSSFHVSYSKGFSPPTLWEVLNTDGSLNTGLSAELGSNLEIGFKGHPGSNRIHFELTGYSMTIDNTIVERMLSTGETVFENSGTTLQNGVESILRLQFVDPENHKEGSSAQLWASLALNDYAFETLIVSGVDYSGLKIPGIEPLGLSVGFQAKFWKSVHFSTDARWVSEIPLDFSNAHNAPSRLILNMRLELNYLGRTNNKIKMFVGVNNWLDESWSSFLQMNAAGGRYYNPSPGRNVYAGLGIAFFSKKK